MSQVTDEVVDLEAFHHDLLNSVNNVRRMVVSWLPPSAELESFKNFDDTNVNLETLRTRPERLGLGAKPSSSKTSAAALANVNSAEGRMLKTLLGGSSRKRKASEEAEIARPSTSGSKVNGQTVINGINGTAASDSEEEDSRSKSISVKGKKKADLFHDKPSKQVHNGEGSSKKQKKQKQNGSAPGSEANGAALDTFAKPSTPIGNKKQATSAPSSPTRLLAQASGMKPPHAVPPNVTDQKSPAPEADCDEQTGEDDESIMTETTMTGTMLGSPGAEDGEQKKKKKRKNKKKKNKTTQGLGSEASQNGSSGSAMLFGSSILD